MVAPELTKPSPQKRKQDADDTVNRNRKKSAILSILAELRNIFYRYALVEKDPITVWWDGKRFHPHTPQLVRTSRIFNKEAMPIYYAENTFLFTDSMLTRKALATFFRADRTKLIQSVKVTHPIVLQNSLDTRYVKFSVQKSERGASELVEIDMARDGEQNIEICCCSVRKLISDYSVVDAAREMGELAIEDSDEDKLKGRRGNETNPLAEMLIAYGAMLEKCRPGGAVGACEECGHVKGYRKEY